MAKRAQQSLFSPEEMLPPWIPAEEFKQWAKMRNEIKKPLDETTTKMAITMLTTLGDQGEDIKLVLQQSIFHRWQGLFRVKAEFQALMKGEDQFLTQLKDRSWADQP